MNRCLGLKLSKERLQGPFLFYGALAIKDIKDTFGSGVKGVINVLFYNNTQFL